MVEVSEENLKKAIESMGRMAPIVEKINQGISEIVRVNDTEPFHLRLEGTGTAAAADIVDSEPMKRGYVYIITSISARDETNTTTLTLVGYSRTKVFRLLGGGVPTVAIEPVGFSGQAYLLEGDTICGKFIGATAADALVVDVHGYRFKVRKE